MDESAHIDPLEKIQVTEEGTFLSKLQNFAEVKKDKKPSFPQITGRETSKELNPGDCLAFRNFTFKDINVRNMDGVEQDWCSPKKLKIKEYRLNYVEFLLRYPVVIKSFRYVHVAKEKLPKKKVNAKPKCFQFLAKSYGDTDYVPLGYGVMMLEEDEYVVRFDNNRTFDVLRVYVSNHGMEFTCLYRMAVGGVFDENNIDSIVGYL